MLRETGRWLRDVYRQGALNLARLFEREELKELIARAEAARRDHERLSEANG